MSSRSGRSRHKWALDFARGPKGEKHICENLPSPVGYLDRLSDMQKQKDDNPNLIVKKSWEVALGPLKQIPMNLFIMWMAGNTISIFPIMMVGMMFFRPIQALFSVQQTFKMIEGTQAQLQRAVYFLGNVVCLGLAVYKCQVMGLLPTHPSDWLAFVEPQKRMEWSGGGMSL